MAEEGHSENPYPVRSLKGRMWALFYWAAIALRARRRREGVRVARVMACEAGEKI